MSTTALGVLVLWFGWFGFNPGSTMAASANDIGRIAVTTNMAGAAATLSATAMAWLLLGKPDLSMILNGCLAGLVAVTASCAYVSVGAAVVIGLIAGLLVVPAVLLFDKVRLDDPVGALSVHLVNGVFGTLAVGLFAQDAIMPGTTGNGLFYGGGTALLGRQALGAAAVGLFTFAVALVAWLVIRAVIGLRVSREEELGGLDMGEHGMEAYPDFQGFLTK
jgi:Amt family ammonium transporter